MEPMPEPGVGCAAPAPCDGGVAGAGERDVVVPVAERRGPDDWEAGHVLEEGAEGIAGLEAVGACVNFQRTIIIKETMKKN